MDHDAILEKVISVVNDTLEVPADVELTDDASYDSFGWLVRHHERAVEFCMRDFLNHEWVKGSHYVCQLGPQ